MKRDPNCTLCRLHQTAPYVCLLGQGPRQCDVMIIGEAPGESKDDPFVGRSGKLLERVLTEHGFEREEVFIANAVSCRPPDNRTPTKSEIKACKKWLDYQIDKVKPKYVLLLGNVPLQSITGKAGITKRRGKPFEQDGIIFLPTFHPSFILRDPGSEAIFDQDIKLFRDIVDFGGVPEEKGLNTHLVLTWDDFDDMKKSLTGVVSFDIETNCLYPWQTHDDKGNPAPAKIVSIGFGTSDAQWIIPVNHPQSPWEQDEVQDMVDEISEFIDELFVVMHNGKFDLLWMWVHFGVQWPLDFDTMLAHYLIDENMRHGLKFLAQVYCGAPDWEVDLDVKQGQSSLKKLSKYHAHDLFYTRKLRYVLGRILSKDWEVKRVFDKILMPCARMFVEIEMNGVYIDETKFAEAETYLRQQYDDALRELKKWEPDYVLDARGRKQKFNWGSTTQLAKLLFGSPEDGIEYGLGLDVVEYTNAGNPSCSESVIKRIDHPCTEALLKFREAKQQLSFFIDGWKPFLHRKANGDIYLHPSFKLHGTVTGRLSCEHPNLQQVPRDKRIRSLITAPKGWTLIECDLSQIELRIAAELANEQAMLHAFANNIDVHWLTAIREIARGGGLKDLVLNTARTWKRDKSLTYAQSIEVLLEMGPDAAAEINPEWKEYRKKAKAINFGYLYGMWWKKFKIYARDNYGVTVTDEEAQASREAFFDAYPGYPNWHDRQRRYVRKHGYVKSLSGRKRRLPEALSAEDTPERREAERQAINSPVQSFANELNLMAALQLREEYSRKVVRICGTVHDAILLRVRNDYVEEVHNRLLEIMRRPKLMDEFGIDIFVPIEGEGKVGPWGDGVPLDKWLKEQSNAK